MKILGIESSTQVASVAVIEGDTVLGELTYNLGKTHSEKLLPMVRSLLSFLDMAPAGLDGLAVALGPGSFTGLRIGLATAKGLAYALERPLVGVNTLDALAWNLRGVEGGICPLINARRGECYAAVYDGQARRLSGYIAGDVGTIQEAIREAGLTSPVFLGDGALVVKEELERAFPGYRLAEPGSGIHRGSSVALLGRESFDAGRMEDIYAMEPFYIRESGAERIWKENQAKGECR